MTANSDQRPTVRDLILARLPYAKWHYDEDADEMDILLPGSKGRGGIARLVNDEYYIRADVETNEPLSIIIPSFSDWLANKLADQVRRSRIRLLGNGTLEIEAASGEGLFTVTGVMAPKSSLSSPPPYVNVLPALQDTLVRSPALAEVA